MTSLTRRDALRCVASTLSVGLAGCTTGATDDLCGTEPPSTDSTIPADPAGSAPSPPTDADWPMYQHDSGLTGFTQSPGPTDDVRLVWTASTGDAEAVTRPITADATVVVSDRKKGVLKALAPTDGSVVWSVTDLHMPTSAASVEGLAVVGDEADLHAFDLGTGTKQWSFTIDVEQTTSTPETAETSAGSTRETATDETAVTSQTPLNPGGSAGIDSAPMVVDDTVLVQSANRIYAIASDGTERWHHEGYVGAVSEGTVYLRGQFGLRAVALASGRTRWTRRSSTLAPQMAIRDGTIYAGGLQTMTAVDAEAGETQWTFEAEAEEFVSPTVTGDTVLAASSPIESGDGGNLYALDRASGEPRWCQYLGWGSLHPPAATADTVYVGVPVENESGTIEARTVDEGRLRWRYRPPADQVEFRAPAVVGGLLLVGSTNGTVYAFAER